MEDNKQLTEQELDNVTGGAAYMKFKGVMQRGFIVGPINVTDPYWIPGDTFRPSRNNLAKRNYRLIPNPTVV